MSGTLGLHKLQSGIRALDGALVQVAAHDDLYRHDYLETCVRLLDENPDIVLALAQGVGRTFSQVRPRKTSNSQ
jgi:hypothetical protein